MRPWVRRNPGAFGVLLRQISTGEVSGERVTIAPVLVTRDSVAAP